MDWLIKHHGPGQIEFWEGGNTSRQFVVWAGSHSWYLFGIGATLHEAEVIKACLKL